MAYASAAGRPVGMPSEQCFWHFWVALGDNSEALGITVGLPEDTLEILGDTFGVLGCTLSAFGGSWGQVGGAFGARGGPFDVLGRTLGAI